MHCQRFGTQASFSPVACNLLASKRQVLRSEFRPPAFLGGASGSQETPRHARGPQQENLLPPWAWGPWMSLLSSCATPIFSLITLPHTGDSYLSFFLFPFFSFLSFSFPSSSLCFFPSFLPFFFLSHTYGNYGIFVQGKTTMYLEFLRRHHPVGRHPLQATGQCT